jgi:hypothetical protein
MSGSPPGRLAVADRALAAVLAVTKNSRQAANNLMITGSDGGRGADPQAP